MRNQWVEAASDTPNLLRCNTKAQNHGLKVGPIRDRAYLSGLLRAERTRRGTRAGTRMLGCFKQAVLVIRWLLDGTRVVQLARDNGISRSTAYDRLHEGIGVLAGSS